MNRRRAWWIAARPHTLWAAVVPVLVGAGLAWNDRTGNLRAFRWDVLAVTLAAALAIQVAANFANDASDARRGADTDDRLGPPRVVALGIISERAIWVATWVALTLAAVGGIYLATVAGPAVIVIGVVSVLAMLGYVGGPVPYGYRGLGEVFVFVFFGLVATVGSRYVYDRSAPLDAWLLAVPVGLLVTAILVANNIRDIDTDAATGKRTLAVILGRAGTAGLFAALVWGAFFLIAGFAAAGLTPRWTVLAVAAMPLGVPLVRAGRHETAGPPLIAALKGTARLHLAAGVLLAAGAMLGSF